MSKLNIPTLGITADNLDAVGTGGLAIGDIPNRRRIAYDGSTDSFAFLGDENGYASISVVTLKLPTAAVASPANGQVWFDGTDLRLRTGGVTKTVTVT